MTQVEAARDIGVTVDTLVKWELGVRRPGLQRLQKAARTYGVSVDFFLPVKLPV
jgi:transcriptional regulator with XRE-family HTH domain